MGKVSKLLKKVILSDRFTTYIRLTLFIAIVVAIFQKAWMNVFVCALAYILTYSHLVFRKYNIDLPKEFQVFVVLFVYCSLFLWEVFDYYHRFAWWDTLLHWFSWVALWFIGFIILYIFYKTWKFKAPPVLISILAFCFALSLWAIWEIFEYSVDEFLWGNMQRARNLELTYWYFDTRFWVQDTMHDLIIDSVWAFIASLSWYFYLKKWESFKWFNSMLNAFEKANKKLFQ